MGAHIGRRCRSFALLAAGAFSLVATAQTIAVTPRQDDAAAVFVDDVENSKFQFIGQISSENALLRSGPGENHYPTLRLTRGAEVTVIGMKFDWLKVLAPEGSYSAIKKDFVQRGPGDNSRTGTVTATNVNVRAAGNVSNLKTMVQCQLDVGDEVTILGEEDGYYQIKPPAEAYFFVNQKFVTPVKQINVLPVAKQERRQQIPVGTFETQQPQGPIDGSNAIVVGPTTKPVNGEATAQKPTTQPVKWDLAKIEGEFDRLEDLVRESSGKRIDEQPIRDLIAGYEGLGARENLPATMRQVTQVRLLTLRAKLKSQDEYLATKRMQDEGEKRLAQFRAERQAVEQRMLGNVTTYTAVGTLQASTLQSGTGTLYRLTDPATGRTLCYVRGTKDPKFVTYVDKFVGVKGELTTDASLGMKVIPAAEIAAVDPQQVNKSVVAQLIPASIVSKALSDKK